MKISRILAFYGLCLSLLALTHCRQSEENRTLKETSPPSNSGASTSALRNDGKVTFFSKATGKPLATVTVQSVSTPEERTTGLMYRSSLPDTAGMLFVFERAETQAFWMKNTAISLDIIFANDAQEIVKVHAYAVPYAIDSYRSEKPAQYVVEVNGGFCEKYGIKEGDRLEFPAKLKQ